MSSNGPNGGPMNERAVGRDNKGGGASPSTPKAPPLSSLQEWEAMFHAIPCGVLLMDIKGNILAVNGHTETLFDYWAMQLTPTPTRYSVSGHGALSCQLDRLNGHVLDRGIVFGVSGANTVANWL